MAGNTFTIAVIDGSDAFDDLSAHLNSEIFRVIAKSDNGLDGLRLCLDNKPDVVILDLLLSGLDGYHVISELRKALPSVKIIVASALNQDSFVQRAFRVGANYYLLKPITLELLESRILELMMPDPDTEDANANTKALDERISNIFISVGIPAHIKGYQFLREAIKLSMSNPDAISKITKYLYPSVAERFHTTPSKVERAIRHAIEVAWNRGKIENINTIFGVKIYSNTDKPTNGEFIALVADKMLIESA